jgi:hypothetical protein
LATNLAQVVRFNGLSYLVALNLAALFEDFGN